MAASIENKSKFSLFQKDNNIAKSEATSISWTEEQSSFESLNSPALPPGFIRKSSFANDKSTTHKPRGTNVILQHLNFPRRSFKDCESISDVVSQSDSQTDTAQSDLVMLQAINRNKRKDLSDHRDSIFQKQSAPRKNLAREDNHPDTFSSFLAKPKEMANIWDPSVESRIVWTLKKELKSKEDAEFIYETIKSFPFFSNFVAQNLGDVDESAILQLCKHLKYEQISGSNYVFEEGDQSNNKLYIVLTGSVSVILNEDKNVFIEENLNNDAGDEECNQATQEREELAKLIQQRRNSNTTKKVSIPTKKFYAAVDALTAISTLTRCTKKTLTMSPVVKKESGSNSYDTLQNQDIDSPSLVPKQTRSNKSKVRKRIAAKDPQGLIALATQLGMINKEIKAGEAFGEKALTSKDEKRSASILTNEDCEFIILMKVDYLNIVGKYNLENKTKLQFLRENIPFIDKVLSTSILDDYLYIFNTGLLKRGNKVIEEGQLGSKVYLLVAGQCRIEKVVCLDQNFSAGTKKIFIGEINAPAIIGEEVLFEKKETRYYKYTVKVSSTDAKFYYCQASLLKIRFPKETLQKLKENLLSKDEHRMKQVEFICKHEKDTLLETMSKSVNPNVKDLIGFATRSCRSGFVLRPNALPTSTINKEDAPTQILQKFNNATTELDDKKKILEGFSRNSHSIRLNILKVQYKSISDAEESILKPHITQTPSSTPLRAKPTLPKTESIYVQNCDNLDNHSTDTKSLTPSKQKNQMVKSHSFYKIGCTSLTPRKNQTQDLSIQEDDRYEKTKDVFNFEGASQLEGPHLKGDKAAKSVTLSPSSSRKITEIPLNQKYSLLFEKADLLKPANKINRRQFIIRGLNQVQNIEETEKFSTTAESSRDQRAQLSSYRRRLPTPRAMQSDAPSPMSSTFRERKSPQKPNFDFQLITQYASDEDQNVKEQMDELDSSNKLKKKLLKSITKTKDDERLMKSYEEYLSSTTNNKLHDARVLQGRTASPSNFRVINGNSSLGRTPRITLSESKFPNSHIKVLESTDIYNQGLLQLNLTDIFNKTNNNIDNFNTNTTRTASDKAEELAIFSTRSQKDRTCSPQLQFENGRIEGMTGGRMTSIKNLKEKNKQIVALNSLKKIRENRRRVDPIIINNSVK